MNKDLILKLKRATGAGFSDINDAIKEANGDEALALEIINKKLVSRSLKKQDNEASKGLLVLKSNSEKMVLLNFRTQTDFSHGEAMVDFMDKQADIFLNSDLEKIELADSFKNDLELFIGKLGENVVLNNQAVFFNDNEFKYIYYLYKKFEIRKENGELTDDLNILKKCENITNYAVVVKVNCDTNDLVARKVAMHIAGMEPESLNDLFEQEFLYESGTKVSEFLEFNKIILKNFFIFNA